jgi:hypothetical protein
MLWYQSNGRFLPTYDSDLVGNQCLRLHSLSHSVDREHVSLWVTITMSIHILDRDLQFFYIRSSVMRMMLLPIISYTHPSFLFTLNLNLATFPPAHSSNSLTLSIFSARKIVPSLQRYQTQLHQHTPHSQEHLRPSLVSCTHDSASSLI